MEAFFIVFTITVMFIIYISGYFIQEISQKNIFFGVRVPVGYENREGLKKYIKQYKRNYNLCFTVVMLLLALSMVFINYEFYIFEAIIAAIVGVVVININYIVIHKKVKSLKKKEQWKFGSSNVVVVDTNYREKDEDSKRLVVSPWWFTVSAVIILITLVVTLIKYPSLPGRIPTHFNAEGTADIWTDKSYLAALSDCIIQVIMTAFMFLAYKFIVKAKQNLNGGQINSVRTFSRRRRYAMSMFIVALSALINIIFFVINLQTMEVVKFGSGTFEAVIFSMILMPILLLLWEIVRERKERKLSSAVSSGEIIDRDDDQYYILGSFYYNKQDPSLLVEKRMGLGMDLNFARPSAKIFLGLIGAVIIAIVVLILMIPGDLKDRKVDVTVDTITVHGNWGLTINKSEIDKVQLEESFPKVLLKTNGADIGNKLFGNHKLENCDNSILFIVDKTKPFIAVYLKDNRLVLINFSDKNKTKELYESIKAIMRLN